MMMGLGETPPLPGGGDFFNRICVEDKFKEFVRSEYEYETNKFAALSPTLSDDAMLDVHQCYMRDAERLEESMDTTPSHFKRAGLLVYWLRRHKPVVKWGIVNGEVLAPDQQKARDFIVDYGHVYLAFSLGYSICLYFEREVDRETAGKRALPNPNDKYVEAVCYLMKYKSISPHAMGFIYHSLFL